MSDPIFETVRLAAFREAGAPAVAFASGVLTSVGPCAAPRLLAIAGIVSRADRGQAWKLAGAFTAGLVLSYSAFGVAAGALFGALRFSALTYAIAACAMAASGAVALWRDDAVCTHQPHGGRGAGGVFLLGASFALVVSPCCTPLATGIVAATAGDPLYGSALLGCFALGHTVPFALAAAGSKAIADAVTRSWVAEGSNLVGGALTLAFSIYYGVLA